MSEQGQPAGQRFGWLRRRFNGWTTGDYFGLIGGIVGIAGVGVAILSLFVSYKSLEESRESRKIAADAQNLSKKTYERAAGIAQAKVVMEGYLPERKDTPARLIMEPKDGLEIVRLTSILDLRELSPRLVVKNVGEEPVEALLVECKVNLLFARRKSEPREREFFQFHPFLLADVEHAEYQLRGKLEPGAFAIVPLSRVMVQQMARAHKLPEVESDLWGVFEFRCHTRLVGATAYDRAAHLLPLTRPLIWVPAGFAADECKQFLESDRSAVEVTKFDPFPPPRPWN